MRSRLLNNVIGVFFLYALLFSVIVIPISPPSVKGDSGELEETPADRLFHFANGLYKRELYKLAISQYQTFLSQYPDNPKANETIFFLAESYFKLGNFTEANDAFTRYVTNYPDGKMAGTSYFRIGYFEFSQSNYAAAIESLNKASALGGYENAILVQVNYYLGKSYLEIGNFKEAIKYLKEVAGEGSTQLRPHALFAMATAFQKMDDNTNALESFYQLIGEFPNHELIPITLFRVGELLFNFERYEDAASVLRKLLALQPEELIEVAQHRLAWCYYLLKDIEQLSLTVNEFLIRFPESKYKGEAVFLKAEAAYEKGDDSAALKSYLEAVESGGTNDFVAQSYYKLGLIYGKLKEYQKAVEAFDKLTHDYPHSAPSESAIVQSAQIYEKELGNPTEALERYRTYLATLPNGKHTELAAFRIAICQFATEKYDDMAGTFEQFITNFPSSPQVAEAMYYIGWNLERKKDYKKAISYYEQMLASQGSGVGSLESGVWTQDSRLKTQDLINDTRFRLALCYYYAKRYTEASKAFYTILTQSAGASEKKVPEDVLLWLGEYFANENEHTKAVAIYKRLLDENPASKWAERCLFRLGEWYSKAEEWRESIFWYEGMLNGFPSSELVIFAKLSIAEAYENLKEFPEAVKLYESLAKSATPLGARANIGLGNIFTAEKNYEKAILSYMYVAILFDDAELCSRALLGASDCWLAMGDTEKSNTALTELLNRYPDGPYSSEAKKKLER